MVRVLSQAPYFLPSVAISIDDLYLPHRQLSQLALDHPSNQLIQHRGLPSTHDIPLALSLFTSLRDGKETIIPTFDKSAFGGQGDRTLQQDWKVVNKEKEKTIKIVIFEGWCVGFRALESKDLQVVWAEAVAQKDEMYYSGRLGWTHFDDLEFVNEALKKYDVLTEYGLRPKS